MKRHADLAAIADKLIAGNDGEEGGFWRGVYLDGPDDRTRPLNIMASFGEGWDHVSVSLGPTATRTPNWNEMEAVRRMFFHDTETVVQIHPPLEEYKCIHKGVLHLWRFQEAEHPTPPGIFV